MFKTNASSAQLKSCVKRIESNTLDENESDMQYFIERNFDSLSALNKYDMMLYFYALNSM